MATDTSFGEVRLFDDFIGDTLDTNLWAVQSDGTAFAIAEEEDGVITCSGTTNGHIQSIFGAEIWQPDVMGTIVFEARVRLNTSITQGVFVGLTDENDVDEMPADLDTGTLTTTAVDVVGFVYDSQEGTNWYIVSSKAGSDGAQTSAGVGPTAATWQTFRIVVESNGDCRFFINGDEVTTSGAARSAAITATIQFAPCVAQLCSGTASGVSADYIYMSGGRA